jgi:hypothetical protein
LSGETEETHPTEQEVAAWFEENFGSALFPSESRREWVKNHWGEIATNGQGGGAGKEPLKLCPDLAKYLESPSTEADVAPEAGPGGFEIEYDRAEIADLRNKVDRLESLVYRLTLESFRKSRQDPHAGEQDR